MSQNNLNPTRTDHAAAILRGALGGVPVLGSALSELVSYVIPNQRVERAVRYLTELSDRLEALDRRINSQNDKTVDLFEDTLSQSTRALSDDRNTYLARLMVDSADVSPTRYEFNKKLLQILAELTDKDIDVLRAYSDFASSFVLERDWPFSASMTMAERKSLGLEEKFARESGQISLRVHREALQRLGLLQPKRERADGRLRDGGSTIEFASPPVDEETGLPRITHYEVTTLGKLLLTRIFGTYVD